MAKPANKKSETKITRIKATDSGASTKKPAAKKAASVSSSTTEVRSERTGKRPRVKLGIFASIGRYLKGSWYELQQVRWPDRRATWGMTGALLAFTAFFVVVILLLDAAFAYLFKLIIGS
jgi:preprotein translocase SecE subunit